MTENAVEPVASPGISLVQKTWWRGPLIWAVFLALLYVLRDFFLIGFLTFLVCFVVRALVGFLERRFSPQGLSPRLDLTFTVLVILVFCLVLYGLGRYFVPPVMREGKSLLSQLQHTSASELQDSLLANTVGAWQFHNQYGTSQEERYQTAFRKFQESDRAGEGLYRTFPQLEARLQAEFESHYPPARLLQSQWTLPRPSAASEPPRPLHPLQIS